MRLHPPALLLAAALACATWNPPALAQEEEPATGMQPAAQDKPNYARTVAEQTRRAHAQPVQLLFVGDSITAIWMRRGPPAWADHRAVWDRWYGDRQAFDMGVGGDQTQNVLWRLQQGEADGLHPRLVVLLIGVNDIAARQTPEQTAAGVAQVVAELHRRLPASHILLLGILPHTPAPRNAATMRVNSLLARQAPAWPYVTYRDIGRVLLQADGTPDPSLYMEGMKPDERRLLHPDADGAERIAEAIEPDVARWLGDRDKRASP